MNHDPVCPVDVCVCEYLARARSDERERADRLLVGYQETLTSSRFKDIVIACRLLVAVTAKQSTGMIQ